MCPFRWWSVRGGQGLRWVMVGGDEEEEESEGVGEDEVVVLWLLLLSLAIAGNFFWCGGCCILYTLFEMKGLEEMRVDVIQWDRLPLDSGS